MECRFEAAANSAERGQARVTQVPAKPSVALLQQTAAKAFGYAHCELEMDGLRIKLNEELTMALQSHEVREVARKVDVLEAALESTRAALSSSDNELHYQGIHALWELACDRSNHRYLSYATLEALVHAAGSDEMRVQSINAAIVWKLAENESTISRLPINELVPALLHAVLGQGTTQSEGGEPSEEMLALANAALERNEPLATLLPDSVEEEASEDDLQAARAVACTGYSLLEQRVWQAGAVLALLSVDAGCKVFHKTGVAMRLLPLLEAPTHISPPPLKAACTALLARAAEFSPPVCKSLLESGLTQLVGLVSAKDGHVDWRTRMQTVDLLRFTCARVRLTDMKPADVRMLPPPTRPPLNAASSNPASSAPWTMRT